MVSTGFPLGGSVGFLTDAEGRTLPGVAVRSHVKLATDPLELANHCNSQPVLHHLAAVYIIRQTARPATRSRCSTPDHINYLSQSSPGAAQITPTRTPHGYFLSIPLGFRPNGREEADKCNEIQNLRAITEGGQSRGAAICNHF